ncbi:MAG: hypothetical protein K5841_00170 [Fretibacterium sp.]|nr:hypothetical protein [Fretibacterium sp.]
MKRFLVRLGLVLTLSLCIFSAAWAANPEDALSAKPKESLYTVLRVEDLGSFLRWAVSEENLKIFAPLADLDEDSIQMITSTLANIPVKSAALVVGMTAEGMPFLQAALSGAEAENVGEFVLGKGSPMAPMIESMLQESEIAFEMKDGLLLLSFGADGLKESLAALEDESKRLSIKRRFPVKDYAFIHTDFDTSGMLAKAAAESEEAEENFKNLKKYFHAPLDVELGFESFKDRFLLSLGTNLKEAMNPEYLKELEQAEAVPGGHIRLLGNGSPLLAMGSTLNLKSFKRYDELKDVVEEGLEALKGIGLSKDDIQNLVNGAFSLTIGGSFFQCEGISIPAICLTQSGQENAASSIVGTLGGKDDLPLNPVQAEGWDKMLQVDSSISPVPCLLGVQGETLFFGLNDVASLAGTPSPAPKLQELLAKESLGGMYLDFAGVQDYLKGAEGPLSMVLSLAESMTGDDSLTGMAGLIRDVLEAKLSIPSVSIWGSNMESCFIEFALADVPAGEGLWAKLAKLALAIQEIGQGDGEEKEKAE